MVKATIRVDNEVLTSECKAALVISIKPASDESAASSLMLAGETNVVQVIGESANAIGGYIRQMGKSVKGRAGAYRVEKNIAIPVEK